MTLLSDKEVEARDCLREGSILINPKYFPEHFGMEDRLRARCRACWHLREFWPDWVKALTLVFDGCESTPISAYRPIEIANLSGKALDAARGRLHETFLKSKKQPSAALTFGPYDEIYSRALDFFDGESLSIGLQGKARIVAEAEKWKAEKEAGRGRSDLE